MNSHHLLTNFMNEAAKNKNILASHISLYSAILCYCDKEGDLESSFHVNRRELMRFSKLASTATYHKCMKDLVKYDFIIYEPSYHPQLGSQVSLSKEL